MLLDEKVIALEQGLSRGAIPHAFGGALALAYYATPRGTQDIDVNVFIPVEASAPVFAVLSDLGVEVGEGSASPRLQNEGQIRVYWGATPIDLFFSYDPLHDHCMERIRTVAFGDDASIPVLSAEDLVIFKVLFDRPKDRRDVRELLFSQGHRFDAVYAREMLNHILDPDDPRRRGFETLLEDPS